MTSYKTRLEIAEQTHVPRAKGAREAHLKHLEWLRECAALEAKVIDQEKRIQTLLSERARSGVAQQRAVFEATKRFRKIGKIEHYYPDSCSAIVPLNLEEHEELPDRGTELYMLTPVEGSDHD